MLILNRVFLLAGFLSFLLVFSFANASERGLMAIIKSQNESGDYLCSPIIQIQKPQLDASNFKKMVNEKGEYFSKGIIPKIDDYLTRGEYCGRTFKFSKKMPGNELFDDFAQVQTSLDGASEGAEEENLKSDLAELLGKKYPILLPAQPLQIDQTIQDAVVQGRAKFYVVVTLDRSGEGEHSLAIIETTLNDRKQLFSFGFAYEGTPGFFGRMSNYFSPFERQEGLVLTPDSLARVKIDRQLQNKGSATFFKVITTGVLEKKHLDRIHDLLSHVREVRMQIEPNFTKDNEFITGFTLYKSTVELVFDDIFYRRVVLNYSPRDTCPTNSVFNCSGIIHHIFQEDVNCNCQDWTLSRKQAKFLSAPNCCRALHSENKIRKGNEDEKNLKRKRGK